MSKADLLEGLNPQQREALIHTDGPILILAGAGSGKTRVISHKFVYLLKSKKIHHDSIFTVTFTNKAAREMKERIVSLSGKNLNAPWIGTFHSQCCRILRREIEKIGYGSDFTIYDDDDQCNLIRHILREFKFHEALFKGFAARISSLKSSLISPEEFLAKGDGFSFDEKLAKVYIRYQTELKRCNALDFDDLIGLTVLLFERYPEILKKYQDIFPYILVDEFQDTNYAQYRLLKLLASGHRNISVVGDDDQSIYRFRGADINNVFRFEKDFPGTRIIKLEQNYRSTQNILDVASAVISRNPKRKPKELWTGKGCGEKVCYCWLNNEDEEAHHIAKTIRELYLKGTFDYRDFAILYRINAQSRTIEESLRNEGIPYRIIGGVSFYQRKEIKDIIAYMRLAINQDDNVSLRRIINTPTRGIGPATLTRIENESKKRSLSLYETIKNLLRSGSFSAQLKDKFEEFLKLIDKIKTRNYKTASDMMHYVLEQTGYLKYIDDEERISNIEELISIGSETNVKEFLEKTALFTNLDEEVSANVVSLMTLHSAKGLEFPVVFIAGLEEGILPYFKALENEDELNEERRLFYVGITRAKEILYLTGARKRKLYAKTKDQEPSRFVSDIPRNCCEWIEKATSIRIPSEQMNNKINKTVYPYVTGCRVRHPKWGIGVVRDCYGEGEEQKVTVNFPSIGIKKLVIRFANLEKI